LKRSQALLAVAEGEAIAAVARKRQVVRNTIYNLGDVDSETDRLKTG